MAWWTEQRLQPKAKSKFVVVFGSNFFIPSIKTISKPKVDFDTKEYKLLNHKFNYPGNATWQPIEMKFVDMNGLGDTNDTFDTSAFLWQVLNNTGYAYPYLDDGSNVSNNPYYNKVKNQKVGSNGGHHIATKISLRDDPNTTDIRERSSFRTITTPEKSSTIANSFGKGLDGNIDFKAAHYSRQKISIYQLSPEGADSDGKGAKIVECWHLVNPIVKSIGWGDLAYDSDDLVEYSLNIVYDWAIYDRKVIGTIFVPDAKPYRDFMKSYGLAQSTIDQELSRQVFEESPLAEEMLGTDLSAFDLDGDGIISRQEAFRATQDAGALLADLEKGFDANQDGEISEGERVFTEARIKEAELLLENAEKIIQADIEAEQQEQERIQSESDAAVAAEELANREADQAALDQAFSDESIAEDVNQQTEGFADDLEIAILEQRVEESATQEEIAEIERAEQILDAFRAEQEIKDEINRLDEILEEIETNEQNELDRQEELREYEQADAEDEERLDRETIQTQAEREASKFFEENNPDDGNDTE